MARRIRPLTIERVADLPGPCFSCALWETEAARALECVPARERERFEEWIRQVGEAWGDAGLIIYDGSTPLGFVKYAPGRLFPQAARMPSGPPDDDSVLIACMHVDPDVRDAGLGKVLLHAALRDLVSRKERVVEAYAAGEAADRDRSPLMSVEFLLRQGFRVARPHPLYPLMKLELKSLATWAESLDVMLEAIQLPRRLGERVPAPLANAIDLRRNMR